MKSKREGSSGILEFIEGNSFFSKLHETSVMVLARTSRIQCLAKGEVLFFQSDPSEMVYIVRSGYVSIVLNSTDGRDMVINEMRSGDMFGELGILTKLHRSTSAIARTDCEILSIPSQTFLRILDDEPKFARRLLEMMANRLQRSGEREGALAFMDAQTRLARLLLVMDKQEHEKGYITISQDELAHHSGLIRQTVAKVLGKWRRDGWLLTGRGRIMLLNHKALEKLENQDKS